MVQNKVDICFFAETKINETFKTEIVIAEELYFILMEILLPKQ